MLLEVTGAPADIEATHTALDLLCGPNKALSVDKQVFDDAQSYLRACKARYQAIRSFDAQLKGDALNLHKNDSKLNWPTGTL